jgi:hypothetical protein
MNTSPQKINSPNKKRDESTLSKEIEYVVELSVEQHIINISIFKEKRIDTKKELTVYHPRFKHKLSGRIIKVKEHVYNTSKKLEGKYIYDLENVLTEDENGFVDTKRSSQHRMGDVYHVESKDVIEIPGGPENNTDLKRLLNPQEALLERLVQKEKEYGRNRVIGDLDFGSNITKKIHPGSYVEILDPSKYYGAKFAQVKHVYILQEPRSAITITKYNVLRYTNSIIDAVVKLALFQEKRKRRKEYGPNAKKSMKNLFIKTNGLDHPKYLILNTFMKYEKKLLRSSNTNDDVIYNLAKQIQTNSYQVT